MKLEKLTKAQEAQIPIIKDKWINRFKEGWVDKESAETQIKWLYKFCGMKEPFVWFVDSPMMAQIIANLMLSGQLNGIGSEIGPNVRSNVRSNVESNVRSNVWSNVRSNVESNVWSNVRSNVWSNVRSNVWSNVRSNVESNVESNVRSNVWSNVRSNVESNVRSNVESNVWSNVRSNVESNVGSNVRSNVWSNVRSNVWSNILQEIPKLKFQDFAAYGSCGDYGWVSFYDFFDSIGFDLKNDNFSEFRKLLWSGIYDMIQFENVCIAVSLPLVIRRDSKQRLHCEEGPAIIFRDGYAQWYWKGTFIPQHWVEAPESISIEELRTDNVEQRRVLIEILGVSEYYERIGGSELTLIDEDIDNQGLPMKLFSFDFQGRNIQMLECICPSTKRVYNISSPNQKSRNVWDAKAGIIGLTEKECRALKIES